MLEATSREDALSQAASALRAAGIEGARRDAELLLCEVLQIGRTSLIAHPEMPMSSGDAEAYRNLVARRAAREPLPYLIGKHPFLDFTLHVGPGVLLPRPETELLVEVTVSLLSQALDEARAGGPSERLKVLDVGTGSGAVAIGLALRLPELEVLSTDLSETALATARRNVDAHHLNDRIHLVRADLFPGRGFFFAEDASPDSWMGRVNAVVSNPPYIPSGDIDRLQPEVSRFEPRLALDGGADGLQAIRRLVREAAPWLCDGGILVFEVGSGQAPAALSLLREAGYTHCRTYEDLAGIERVVVGRRDGPTCQFPANTSF